MTSPSTVCYPDQEFLKDLARWQREVADPSSQNFRNAAEAAIFVFSLQYGDDENLLLYRLTRFLRIVDAIEGSLPMLVADRIARKQTGQKEEIPVSLLLALLAWCRKLSDDEVDKAPDPDWPRILMEFDRLEPPQ